MTRTDTLDVASAAARAAGHGAKEAARIGRLVAMAVSVLRRHPTEPMGVAVMQAELRKAGVDPCARLVLERALTAALDAGVIERRTDGRLQLPWDF